MKSTITYPSSLTYLARDLRQCDTQDVADATVQMVACQIARTGRRAGGRSASPEEKEWAARIDEARVAAERR